jgi:hypothetical protein
VKTPPHIMTAILAAAFTAPPGRRMSAKKKPKAVDKRKQAKRRQAKASKKRNWR